MKIPRPLEACHFVTLVFLLIAQSVAQSWKTYPSSINGYPEMSFPAAEANHPQYQSDTWFLTARVRGAQTGKDYQIATIFARNTITAILLNFYEVSIFDCSNGDYVTYTDYDLPIINLPAQKIRTSNTNLDITYHSSAGDASWRNAKTPTNTIRPFTYDLYLPGTDSFTNTPFSVNITADMPNPPIAFGADALKGKLTVFGEPGTFSYFQTRPNITGTLTYKGITEAISGSLGHLDRQWFPLTPLFWTPTGRQRSHEWRQINLDNGIDLSIWRQFDRENGNKLSDTTGTTSFSNATQQAMWINGLPSDLTVEYFSYAKFPRSKGVNTLIPPPSLNMYIATTHVLRSASLGLELFATYSRTPAPAVNLVIEYFEGPYSFNGTFFNTPVTGTGIFESTFALYRHWELVDVLADSVRHLSDSSFAASMTREQVLGVVDGVREYVSWEPLRDDRVAAGVYIREKIVPAVQTMVDEGDRMAMLEIVGDFETSLALVAEF